MACLLRFCIALLCSIYYSMYLVLCKSKSYSNARFIRFRPCNKKQVSCWLVYTAKIQSQEEENKLGNRVFKNLGSYLSNLYYILVVMKAVGRLLQARLLSSFVAKQTENSRGLCCLYSKVWQFFHHWTVVSLFQHIGDHIISIAVERRILNDYCVLLVNDWLVPRSIVNWP